MCPPLANRTAPAGPLPAQGCAEPGSLSDSELLAPLIAAATGEAPAPEAAYALLQRHGSLRALLGAAQHAPAGLDPACVWLLRCAHELFRRQLRQELQRGEALTSPAETLEYLRHTLGNRRREIFQCLFLDTRHRVIHSEEMFQGSIDGACVYPRVVAERALRHNAAAVIVAHNHPSGVTEPSLADQAITRRLKEALALFEIRLLDHFVIGEGEPVSMAARGMI
jgi:DNA repair protein RadC